MAAPRPLEQRKADTLVKLSTKGIDVWVASATADADARLVPLSFSWDGDRVILATETRSVTYENLERTGRCRLGLGPERDVVMIDAVVVSVVDAAKAPRPVGDTFAAQADWDPRDDPDGYAYLVLAPERIQAWREANEISGRTIMRRGQWLV